MSEQQAAETDARVSAMLLPLRSWLTHAGYGMNRLNAARKALDDFEAALTPSCGCGSPGATALDAAEVVVHRTDGPCHFAPTTTMRAVPVDDETCLCPPPWNGDHTPSPICPEHGEQSPSSAGMEGDRG